MASNTYTVKSGDTLWGIASRSSLKSQIAGSTTKAKVDTLAKINNIRDPDLIIIGQVLKLSSAGGSNATAEKNNQVTIDWFGLNANDTSGRAMVVTWKWTKKSNTAGFVCRWSQWLNNKWVGKDQTVEYPETAKDHDAKDRYHQDTFTADAAATKVKLQILPYYKADNEKKYYSGIDWSDTKEYDFSDNPPKVPDTPSIKLDDLTLTMTIDNIDAEKLGATGVKFQVIRNNEFIVLNKTAMIVKNTEGKYLNYVSHQCDVVTGSKYKVRACCINAKGKESGWSSFSSNVETKPSAPSGFIEDKCKRVKRSDGNYSVYLEWKSVENATHYIIEYVSVPTDFENATNNIQTAKTEDNITHLEITNMELGNEYYFRVKAANSDSESEPSGTISIPLGKPPAAPTTWASSNSAFVGETMELNWTHNTQDNSDQTYANLHLKIGDNDWVKFIIENTTNEFSGDQTVVTDFTYGRSISYKGSLHVVLNTSHSELRDKAIQWKVQTAGVSARITDSVLDPEEFSDASAERTIYIYEKPTLALSVTDSNGEFVETLTSFPCNVHGRVDLESYEIQRPVGYHLRVVSNDYYVTVDDAGREKTINSGDVVYSKYFNVTDELEAVLSADNIDLEPETSYTLYCTVNMSTGLTIDQSHTFTVSWEDVEYYLDATVTIDETAYTASVTPRCIYSGAELVDDVVVSVYRREYDGTLTEIAKNIPNNGTSVTDPHPSLDYARYRLVAKNTATGAISFYDMPGHPVNGRSIIVQWDEVWSSFDVEDEYDVGGPSWSGSLLKLSYNIDVTDKRTREVELVKYAGREHPVTYYGVHRDESSTWNVVIPKTDKETIYALRKLSLWSGDVYVREPSGIGYWANIGVSFNLKHDDLTVPVTLNLVRVEGGI